MSYLEFQMSLLIFQILRFFTDLMRVFDCVFWALLSPGGEEERDHVILVTKFSSTSDLSYSSRPAFDQSLFEEK